MTLSQEKMSDDVSAHLSSTWWAKRLLFGIGWVVAIVGAAWAPWVERSAAALVLTAPDLAEFVKFLPEVRSGALDVQRLFFLAPLFLLTLGTPPVFGTIVPRPLSWLRVFIRLAVLPLALMLLPPVWSPFVLISDEFRLQTVGCVLCLVLAIVWQSHWRAPRLFVVLLSFGWVAASTLAMWQFIKVQPAIAYAYASPVAPGWGAWATLGGTLLMSAILWLGWSDESYREDRRAAMAGRRAG